MKREITKILVIGQTPPPFHGQAMMINRLVKANLTKIKIFHLRMNFSSSLSEIGRFSTYKIIHIFQLITKSIYHRYKFKTHVLYYPPAGPTFNAILRDCLLLIAIRPFFRKTVFHFRAAGISEYLASSNFLIRSLAWVTYRRPDLSIQLSMNNPADGKYFKSRKVVAIPNGLEDEALSYLPIEKPEKSDVTLLYIGVLKESKGVMDLLQAQKRLKDEGCSTQLQLVGGFDDAVFERKVRNFIEVNKLANSIDILGVLTGSDKWSALLDSDILCFPTYYESESFGNVVLEGMMFKLPVVATAWRGVQDLVRNGVNGLLVPVKSPEILAESLRELYLDEKLREQMGTNGREFFLASYSLAQHLNAMENELHKL